MDSVEQGTVVGAGVTGFQIATVALVGRWLIKRFSLSPADGWVIRWLIYDCLTYSLLMIPIVVISLQGPLNESDSVFAIVGKDYARADARFGVSDPCTVAGNLGGVLLSLPLAAAIIYGICQASPWRHVVQVAHCAVELYGCFMIFVPEWIIGSPSLNTSDPLLLCFHLVFMNMLWIVIPGALLVQSWQHISAACSVAAKEKTA
eukprot:scpid85039/ scgid9160/ Emopamil-binding protein-like; Emopamil-binding-related protein